jgi:hypothetical protein
MADWRQIQARIRKAKNAPDAHAKLTELYQRTRDAMVAWELALLEEKALVQAEAVKWYTIAAQRFRRSEWKKKAEEALTRLGAELPAAGTDAAAAGAEQSAESHADAHEAGEEAEQQLAPGEITEEAAAESEGESGAATAASEVGADGLRKKRRRGRRGGRGRRRKGPGDSPGLPKQAFAETSTPAVAPHRPPPVQQEAPRQQTFERAAAAPLRETPASRRPERAERVEMPVLQLPSERAAHGRAGDPALASRMTVLESTLRRLLSSPLHRLEQADEAPAGPGVFLLSDSDQTTSYYIEACQTLRIGLGNLGRGWRTGKPTRGGARGGYSESGLKAKLAEHLGINEAKVSQYLKDHCVVRWIQLDDDAPLLAHFAIALLRTPLNLD